MKIWQHLILLVSAFGLVNCGSEGTSPDNESSFVVSEYNMDLYNLFVCRITISEESNADLYASLEYGSDTLATTIRVTYSVFYGTDPVTTERVVRAQVAASGLVNFDQHSSVYMAESNQSSAIGITADVVPGSNPGLWSFAVTADTASFSYDDADLTGGAVTYEFTTAGDSIDCSGKVANDPST